MLFESGVNILLFIVLLSGIQTLIRYLGLVGGGFSIHDTHIMNTILLLHPELYCEEIPLQIFFAL